MSNIKVSIIIPTYNAETYLHRTLESALNQSLQEIEIIPVNDGSTDNSQMIIEKYKQADNRVKPIYKKNGGYASAVNAGLKAAKGDYIAILESDDYVMDDYYYILYQEAFSNELEICRSSSYCEIRDHFAPSPIETYYPQNHDLLTEAHLSEMLALGTVGICQAIYKRSWLLENELFLDEQLNSYEDIIFVARTYTSASRIKIIKTFGYFYLKDNELQSTNDLTKFPRLLKVIDKLWEHMSQQKLSPCQHKAMLGYSIAHLSTYYNRICQYSDNKALANTFLQKAQDILGNEKEIWCTKAVALFIKNLVRIGIATKTVTPKKNTELYELASHSSLLLEGKSVGTLIAQIHYKIFLCYKDKAYAEQKKIATELVHFLRSTNYYSSSQIIEFIKFFLKNSPQYQTVGNENLFFPLITALYTAKEINNLSNIASATNYNGRLFEKIAEFPQIANEYTNNHHSTIGIQKSASLYRHMAAIQKHFEQSIAGKSIAIVGNSPCEVGKGKGKDIDSHDIVIRFNNYTLDSKLAIDYGSKENIWVITPSIESLYDRKDIIKYDYIFSYQTNSFLNSSRVDYYCNLITMGCNFFAIDDALSIKLKTNIAVPSIGLYTLFYLYNLRHTTSSIKLYGFSMTDHYEGKRHYFDRDPNQLKKMKFHKWDRERYWLDFLRYEFQKENA